MLDSSGGALPIFVSTFGFRLESEPVDFSTDVWSLFRMQGLGFSANGQEDVLNPGSPAIASVRFHDNTGGSLTFLLRGLPLLFRHSVTTEWNVKRGALFVHAISPVDNDHCLPLAIHVGSKVFMVALARISTSMQMREPEDIQWDANVVKTLALETIDGAHEFLLDPVTGDWTDRHPVTLAVIPVDPNTAIDLVVLSDLPPRTFTLTDIPDHGNRLSSNFLARNFTLDQNLGLDEYLQVHAYSSVLSAFDLDNEVRRNWWSWPGTGPQATPMWIGVLTVLAFLLTGWMNNSSRILSWAPMVSLPLFVIALILVVYGVTLLKTKSTNNFVLRVDRIMRYGAGTGLILAVLYILMCSRFTGGPSARIVIALLALATSIATFRILSTGGKAKVLTPDTRTFLGIQAVIAAMASLVVAIEVRNNALYPRNFMPAISFRAGVGILSLTMLAFIMLTYTLFLSARPAWDGTCARDNFSRYRAKERVEDPTVDGRALAFYRKEYHDTQVCKDDNVRSNIGMFVLLGVLGIWVLQPVLSRLVSRVFLVRPRDNVTAGVYLHDKLETRRVFFSKLLFGFVIFSLVAYIAVPSSGLLERGELYMSICEESRISLDAYAAEFGGSREFNSEKKEAEILTSMTSLECFPPVALAMVTSAMAFLLLWVFALSVSPRRVTTSVNIWPSAIFALLMCFVVYFFAWLEDEKRRMNLLDINPAQYLHAVLAKFAPSNNDQTSG